MGKPDSFENQKEKIDDVITQNTIISRNKIATRKWTSKMKTTGQKTLHI